MKWENSNVFITGADGFIGSWVAKGLVEKGANVIVIRRDIKKDGGIRLQNLEDKVTLVEGDICDYETIEKYLNEYSIDSCFHLAAQPIVGIANKLPMSTFETNIKGTWTLMEALRNMKTIDRVVVASSDKAYGTHKELPYKEDQSLNGIYPYDASKACTDILSRCYAVSFDLPVAVTRLANVYGGADLHLDRIVPGTIISVMKGETPIIRSDGTPERDYMYAKDAASAYITLAEAMPKFKGHGFNFGTETPISVLTLIKKIIELCSKDIKPKILGEAKNEIDRQYLGSEKAKTELGWAPKYSLEEGLKETIEWYKNYLSK